MFLVSRLLSNIDVWIWSIQSRIIYEFYDVVIIKIL